MAYSLVNTPKIIDFGLNPMGFKAEMEYHARYFRFYFHFHTAPPVGSYLELKWSDKVVKYDVVASADNSGTQLTSSTDLAVITADLNKNTLFANTWDASASSFRLGFHEKDIFAFFPVEANFPEFDFEFYSSSLKFEDPQKLVSELFLKHNGESSFKSKGLAFHSIDYDGFAIIKLTKRVLEGFTPYLPVINDPINHEVSLTEYYLKIWEHWPNDAVSLKELLETDHRFILNGKLPFKVYPTFSLNTPLIILTNANAWREVWKDAHQELTVLVTSDIASFDVKVKLYFDDETDSTEDISTIICSQNKSYYIPAGFNQLNINALTPEGKTCYRYEILIIYDSLTVASSSFLVVDKPDYGKVIRFLNSKGGYDAVCVKGMESKSEKSNIIEAEATIPIFYTSDFDVYQKITTNVYDEYELILGSLTKQEVEHIKEILDSGFVWKQEDSDFIPIVITSNNLELWDDAQDLFTPKITYRYARQ